VREDREREIHSLLARKDGRVSEVGAIGGRARARPAVRRGKRGDGEDGRGRGTTRRGDDSSQPTWSVSTSRAQGTWPAQTTATKPTIMATVEAVRTRKERKRAAAAAAAAAAGASGGGGEGRGVRVDAAERAGGGGGGASSCAALAASAAAGAAPPAPPSSSAPAAALRRRGGMDAAWCCCCCCLWRSLSLLSRALGGGCVGPSLRQGGTLCPHARALRSREGVSIDRSKGPRSRVVKVVGAGGRGGRGADSSVGNCNFWTSTAREGEVRGCVCKR